NARPAAGARAGWSGAPRRRRGPGGVGPRQAAWLPEPAGVVPEEPPGPQRVHLLRRDEGEEGPWPFPHGDPHPAAAGAGPAHPARRRGVPLAVGDPLAIEVPRATSLRARRRRRRAPRHVRGGRGRLTSVRRQLQLAWAGVAADELPHRGSAGAIPPLLP